MPWPTYDKAKHAEQGDEYLKWLKMWNVQIPAGVEEGKAPEAEPQPEPATAEAGSMAVEDDRADDYDEWTNDELREELEKRELSKSGNKDELIARLREDDEAE